MTYREKYARLYPNKNPSEAHEGVCPDHVNGVCTTSFVCPARVVSSCADCWDQQIPGTEPISTQQAGTSCSIIKKALACCSDASTVTCKQCPYRDASDDDCGSMLMVDALAYIETLEERLREAAGFKEAYTDAGNNQP